MTPAQQAAALLQELAAEPQSEPSEPVAVVTECEACFTPDVCQLRGTCDHYSAAKLRVSAHPPRTALTDVRAIVQQAALALEELDGPGYLIGGVMHYRIGLILPKLNAAIDALSAHGIGETK